MNILTVIPARGGSKSIKLKNIQPLNNRPLIEYTIRYSQACRLVSKTIVSTDSELIANISRDLGADVPFIRPHELATDLTQDFPVIQHALLEMEKLDKVVYDAVVLLRPTSPLRPLGLIEKALELIQSNPTWSSVRAVVKAQEHPYRVWKRNGPFISGYIENCDEPYNIPRQQLPDAYFQSGDIEVIKRSTLLIEKSVSGKHVLPLILDYNEMIDIDTQEDLREAELRTKKG